MLKIRDCVWDTKYSVQVSGTQTSISQKLDLYDQKIYDVIDNYFSTINSYASDFINSDDNDLKTKAQFLKNKYKDYNNNIDYYKKLFIKEFNNIYERDNWSIYDLNQKMYDIQTDFLANFPEYYLMVKQTENYTCLYYYAYKKLLFFFKEFGIGGAILCPLDQSVDDFIKNMNDLINWIETNEINDDMSYDEINKQRLKNSYNSYDNYQSYLNKLKNNIHDKGREILLIYNAIGAWMMELQMALKAIALGNIVMTSSDKDTNDFNDIAKVMLTYQSDLEEKYEKTSKSYYMKVKGQKINQQGIPIFIAYRKYLKPDYSNFQQLMISSVRVVIHTCGLTTYSELLIEYLPGGY